MLWEKNKSVVSIKYAVKLLKGMLWAYSTHSCWGQEGGFWETQRAGSITWFSRSVWPSGWGWKPENNLVLAPRNLQKSLLKLEVNPSRTMAVVGCCGCPSAVIVSSRCRSTLAVLMRCFAVKNCTLSCKISGCWFSCSKEKGAGAFELNTSLF